MKKILENAFLIHMKIFFAIRLEGCIYLFLCRVSLLVHMKLAIKLKRNNMKVFLFEDSCLFFVVKSQKHAMRVKDIAC